MHGVMDRVHSHTTIPVFSKPRRLYLCILFVFRFPRIALSFLGLIIHNPLKIWNYLFHLVSQSFAAHMYVVLHKNVNFIIDEGLFQRLLSVAPYPLSEKRARVLVRQIGDAGAIIIVQGGNFSRFIDEPDRSISPRVYLGENYFHNWSHNVRHNFDSIASVAKEKNTVIILDNKDRSSLESLITTVVEYLQK